MHNNKKYIHNNYVMFIKKLFRIIGACLLLFAVAIFAFLGYLFLPDSNGIKENLLAKNTYSVKFYDNQLKQMNIAGESHEIINPSLIPNHVKQSFIAVEDKRFYKHFGIDLVGILRATKNNLRSSSVKEGGSTITQQLIKNTHLSSEKTFRRKIREMKLAIELERKYTKDEILGFYLNGVYFGEGIYGIESASKHYFGVSAQDLTLVQGCALAATVKAPSVYKPNGEKCEERKNLILKLMLNQGFISQEEYQMGVKTRIRTLKNGNDNYLRMAIDELYEIVDISPYENNDIEVYTYYDKSSNQILAQNLEENFQSGIIMSQSGEIKGVKISEGDYERPPASIIKPLYVYAPAIEEGLIHLHTKILDEKCSFSGYSPSNYGEKYYGWISVKESILKSLNVPAVKVLEALGTQKARLYARKLGIEINEDSLNTALGSYNGGVTLKDLCSSYTPFLNDGNYYKPTCIKTVKKNGKSVYENKEFKEKVFSAGTCELINYALKECTLTGTARAIGSKKYEVCAKTGTNGNEKGNTDAYTLCYTSKDIIALRFSYKDNSLMPNEITGAHVAKYASNILDELYSTFSPDEFKKSNEVTMVNLCKFAYENNQIMLAQDILSTKYSFCAPILSKYVKSLPISSFSPLSIECEVAVDGNKVSFKMQKEDAVNVIIEQIIEGNFKKITQTNLNELELNSLKDGYYNFALTPYIADVNGNLIYGDKLILPQIKISEEEKFIQSPWWDD